MYVFIYHTLTFFNYLYDKQLDKFIYVDAKV